VGTVKKMAWCRMKKKGRITLPFTGTRQEESMKACDRGPCETGPGGGGKERQKKVQKFVFKVGQAYEKPSSVQGKARMQDQSWAKKFVELPKEYVQESGPGEIGAKGGGQKSQH